MPNYRCFIRGENFPGTLVDKEYTVGFYTTRFVEASNGNDAESKALSILKSDSRLALPDGFELGCTPKVFFESIDQVDSNDVPSVQPGLSWFPMNEDDADFEGVHRV